MEDGQGPTGRGATGRARPYRTLTLQKAEVQDGRRPEGRCTMYHVPFTMYDVGCRGNLVKEKGETEGDGDGS